MRLHKYILFSILSLIGVLSCKTAQKSENKSQSQNIGNSKSLLWEITGKGISKPSYVYGTIHMIPAQDYFLPKGTLTAIDNSEEMFFEIDMKDMSDMSSLMGMMNKIFMKDGLTLKDILTKEDYKIANEYFTKMGLPMFMLERIKPMFLSAFAMTDMNPNSMKDGKIKSYEMEFYEMAKEKNMNTGGLETIEFQIAVFDSIPYSDQAKMLMETLKSGDSENDEFKKMVNIYKQQDVEAMIEMMSSGSSDLGEHEDILLTKRNINWIPAIIKQAKTKPTFFAVGAGHLGGKNGVLHLLRKEGYLVKPIK
ncbi:MAG: hypothetical protein RLZZ546_255 [Bacteroidota bacterium]|jgi:uncharacterized protein YbaP (TraB family)